MAYIDQNKKKEIKKKIDEYLKPMKFKYSMGVNHHSTLYINIYSGPIDFLDNFINKNTQEQYHQVNEYYIKDWYTGKAKEILLKIYEIMNEGNHDNSDIMSDYFDVGWYTDINIGTYNRPYILV